MAFVVRDGSPYLGVGTYKTKKEDGWDTRWSEERAGRHQLLLVL